MTMAKKDNDMIFDDKGFPAELVDRKFQAIPIVSGDDDTIEDVKLFRKLCAPNVRIKAAGGIRTFEQAQAMLEAGADRIGASALVGLM